MSLTKDDYLKWHELWNEMMSQYCGGRDSCYDLVLDLIGSMLKFPDKAKILDIGCGSGTFTEKARARYNQAEIMSVDDSAKNLHIAKQVVGETSALWIRQDLNEAVWDERLTTGGFDAAFIGWATHEIEPWHLNQFYKNIAGALREGGLLFNVDFMSGLKPSFRDLANDVARKRVTNEFNSFNKKFVQDKVIAKLQDGDDEQRTVWNVRHDVNYHLMAIEATGFKDAEEIWRYMNYSLILAIR